MQVRTHSQTDALPSRTLEVGLVFVSALICYKLLQSYALPGNGSSILSSFLVFVYLPVLAMQLRHRKCNIMSLRKIRLSREMTVLAMATAIVFVSTSLICATGRQAFGLHLHAYIASEALAAFVVYQFVVVALCEEFFFRGYLLDRLASTSTLYVGFAQSVKLPAVHISAVLFMLFHYVINPGYDAILVLVPGVFYGVLRVMSAGIMIPVIVHALSNIASQLIAAL